MHRDVLERPYTVGGGPPPLPPPLPMLEAESQNFASAPSAPTGFKPKNFRPAFGGDGGPKEEEGPSKIPLPPPPFQIPPPPPPWASLGKCSHREGGAPNPPQPHLHLRARMGERTARDLGRVALLRIPHRTEAQVLPSRRDTLGGGGGGKGLIYLYTAVYR